MATIRYTKADWEGVQDDAENAFDVLRRDCANGDLYMVRRSADACKSAVARTVAVANVLGLDYNGSADFEAIRSLTFGARPAA